jgi:hypothetical protein
VNKVASRDITDVHFILHEDNTVSVFLAAQVGTSLDTDPMSRIKVDNAANIYFSQLNNKWAAKWMAREAQGTWCGFGGKCKHMHEERDMAIQCAIGRYMVFRGAM